MKILVLVLIQLCYSYSSKILVIGPIPLQSHATIVFLFAKELARRGHTVVALTPFEETEEIDNYHTIVIENMAKEFLDKAGDFFKLNKLTGVNHLSQFLQVGLITSQIVLENDNIKELLRQDFDLVILEHFENFALHGLANYFKAPVVLLGSFFPSFCSNYLFANPSPSSYIPNIVSLYSPHMNIWQRLHNLFLNLYGQYMRSGYMAVHNELFKKHLNSNYIEDSVYNASLMLFNSHPLISNPVPLLPNMIEIAGYHIKISESLPKDLQDFLDSAEEGALLFSLGSNLLCKNLDATIKNNLIRTFSKIKQKVLWKCEVDLWNISSNVKLMKWLPQQDILAHPNLKAFITHGGIMSVIESVHYGVPIIGIPIYGDQMNNVVTAVANGYAIKLNYPNFSEEEFFLALQEILYNENYANQAKIASSLFRDRPQHPFDTGIFWIESVLRHGGMAHLRSAGLDLKWYQREMIDVFIIILLLLSIVVFAFYFLMQKILRRFIVGQKREKND